MEPTERGYSIGPSIRNSLICKSLLHKRNPNRSLLTANNLNKVFCDLKKSNTLNVRQVANIRYYTGHYIFTAGQNPKTGDPKLSLAMYPFSISIDEHAPLNILR